MIVNWCEMIAITVAIIIKELVFFSFFLLSFCSSQMQLGSVTVRSMNWNLVAKIDWHHDVPVTVIRWNKRHKKNKIPTLSKGEIKFGMAYLMLLMDTNINVTSRENFSVLCFLLFVSFDSITTVSLFFPFCQINIYLYIWIKYMKCKIWLT